MQNSCQILQKFDRSSIFSTFINLLRSPPATAPSTTPDESYPHLSHGHFPLLFQLNLDEDESFSQYPLLLIHYEWR